MKLSRLFVAILILAGAFFFYQNYQAQTDFTQAEAVYSSPIQTIDPINHTSYYNSRLNLVYESLIKVDSTLEFQPNLAVNFGQINPTTWQFTIKQGVKFHNQEPLTPQLIQQNFLELKGKPNFTSELSNIQTIEVNAEKPYQLTFNLNKADPFFLAKIAATPITFTIENLAEEPIGTGPYQVKNFSPSLLRLDRFENYHSTKPEVEQITLSAINNNLDRIQHANNETDVIVVENLSPSFLSQLDTQKFRLQETTDLSLNFFLFNQNRQLTSSISNRRALAKAIPADLLANYTENLGVPTNQFLPNGVLGYNSQLTSNSQNLEEARQSIVQSGLTGSTIKIMLPTSAEKFTLFLQETFSQLGLKPQIDLYDYAQENLSTRSTGYDLIFLGWRNEFGDGQPFFEQVVKSNSTYNLGNYQNTQVNNLINASANESDPSQRSQNLQQAMQIITEQDPIGIPLFENKVFYAIHKNFTYQDRLDGFIDLTQIKQK